VEYAVRPHRRADEAPLPMAARHVGATVWPHRRADEAPSPEAAKRAGAAIRANEAPLPKAKRKKARPKGGHTEKTMRKGAAGTRPRQDYAGGRRGDVRRLCVVFRSCVGRVYVVCMPRVSCVRRVCVVCESLICCA
jgi:hypothetical protein